MNSKLLKFTALLILSGILASCLLNKNVNEPTWEEEQANLKDYIKRLTEKGHNVDTTALGLYYIVIDRGTGPFPKAGDTLTVGYAGYFTDGYMFDTSYWHNQKDSTYTFVLNNPPMIAGWDEGMKLMNKNARLQLIIPSDLAYGSKGGGIIPPYQTLVFVVKMIDIKPSK